MSLDNRVLALFTVYGVGIILSLVCFSLEVLWVRVLKKFRNFIKKFSLENVKIAFINIKLYTVTYILMTIFKIKMHTKLVKSIACTNVLNLRLVIFKIINKTFVSTVNDSR